MCKVRFLEKLCFISYQPYANDLRLQRPKKSLIKNGSSLNSRSPQLQYREVQSCAWQHVITFVVQRFFDWYLVPITRNSFNPTFPFQYLNIAEQRNDIPKGLKIMQLVKKLGTEEKVCPF